MDGKFGFFNEQGQIVISPWFDFASPFSESLAAICIGCRKFKKGEHSWYEGGVWGYIDRLGNIAIPPKFEKARPFEHGKARVMLGGKWAYINKKGELIDWFCFPAREKDAKRRDFPASYLTPRIISATMETISFHKEGQFKLEYVLYYYLHFCWAPFMNPEFL